MNSPRIGQWMTVYGLRCRIVRVHALGTVDVVSECGNYAYRVSGLPLTPADAGHPNNVIL